MLGHPRHSYRARGLDEDDIPGLATLSFWCTVTDKFELRDEDSLRHISDYHIWQDSYALKRLYWRPTYPLTVALVRVYRLQQPQALPVLAEYAGCKSWVELGQEVPLGAMTPVLSDHEYEKHAGAIQEALGTTPSAV